MQTHQNIKTNSNADTAQHCTWVTQTKLIQTEQVFEPWPGWNCFPCNFKTLGGNTSFSVEDQGGSDALMIIATNDTAAYLGGAEVDLDVTPNVASELRIPVGDITAGSFIAVVSEMVNGEPVELASNELVSGTLKKLSFTPTQSEVQLKFVNTSSGSGGLSLFTVDFAVLMPTAVNVLVRVCDESEDWRFGFNGKEKDNEIAGIGNTLDFGARIYASRLGRFLSVDPMAHLREWVSPYNAMQNDPINRVDPTGALDDWVQDADGNIKWDKNATSQATTKEGETYLGRDLTFTFNSYISESWDGPLGSFPEGDKLTSTITLTSNTDANNNLLSVNIKSSEPVVHKTGGIFPGVGYFPGQTNTSINETGMTSGFATYEQHAMVNGFEKFGLSLMGYDAVNVAQKLTIGLSGNNLSITAATDIFPSASLSVNEVRLFQYDQPSFKATHSVLQIQTGVRIPRNPMNDGFIPVYDYKHLRPAPSFHQRYNK